MVTGQVQDQPVVEEKTARGYCPVHGDVGIWTQHLAAARGPQQIARDAEGVWQIHNHALMRQVLRSDLVKQAGFGAELISQVPGANNLPILYQEGKTHHEQRRQTARFFTPKAVSTHYRALMERFVNEAIAEFRQAGRADLSKISMRLAVAVAAEVVGLTNSRVPGLSRRLDAFFAGNLPASNDWFAQLRTRLNQTRMLQFYYLDVRPAIAARRKNPGEDVISHLLARGYNDTEILTECITYAAAGMVTTREFITVAAWYLLTTPPLRERYLAAPEAERYAILEEILRLEPVVGHLYRQTTADLVLDHHGQPITIPAGSKIDLHIYAANRDEAVVGSRPDDICPGRSLLDKQTMPAVMSFGDGHHRCPGSYIAIQESDIFLRRLLALPGLRLDQDPTIGFDPLTASYVVRGCLISEEPGVAQREAADRARALPSAESRTLHATP